MIDGCSVIGVPFASTGRSVSLFKWLHCYHIGISFSENLLMQTAALWQCCLHCLADFQELWQFDSFLMSTNAAFTVNYQALSGLN